MRCKDPRFKPRGKLIGDFDSNIERIAQMRLELDAMRFVVYNAAEAIDLVGPKAGRRAIAQCKILVPSTIEKLVNECMQIFGGQGVTQHTPLPVSFALCPNGKKPTLRQTTFNPNTRTNARQTLWAYARWSRLADGPDSAHRHQVGRDELKKAAEVTERHQKYNRLAKEYAEMYGEKILMMPEDSL